MPASKFGQPKKAIGGPKVDLDEDDISKIINEASEPKDDDSIFLFFSFLLIC